MKRIVAFILGFMVAATLGLSAEEKGTTYGTGVKLTTVTKVADLLASPDQYLGKHVRVDGTVKAVCQNMGCWIQIADDEKSEGIQFKVDDGVIVFPKDAKGKRASAEGTFERLPAEGEAAAADVKEHADHAKEHAEQAKDAAAAKPPAFRIKATGAVIY